ncbi:hypothetical protein ADK97_30330 [Streptomyces sp. H021]|nr:hypothetical protein ADK97_30330 [Streptomyces sp. H021]
MVRVRGGMAVAGAAGVGVELGGGGGGGEGEMGWALEVPTAPPSGGSPPPAPNAPTVTFTCGGEIVKLDPLKPGSLKALTRKLFSVRLVG